mmetsp:Transcript_39740/g.62057  ORF Transcript_39740/g.62057 Transcript_39740/m.62057 type:complete len:104 (+) Transcript_39740:754-1065(+)
MRDRAWSSGIVGLQSTSTARTEGQDQGQQIVCHSFFVPRCKPSAVLSPLPGTSPLLTAFRDKLRNSVESNGRIERMQEITATSQSGSQRYEVQYCVRNSLLLN